jgi:ABC-type lipoprotein release transport system permease subunit
VARAVLPVHKVPITYNLRNLQSRWKTTLVTALAFTLVTALLTVMFAFIQGMYRITQTSAVPENVVVLADGATDEVFSDVENPSVEILSGDVKALIGTFTRKAGARPEYLYSKEVYVLIAHVVQQTGDGGRQRRFIQMRGVDDPVMSTAVHNITLREGKLFEKGSGVRTIRDPNGASDATIDVMEVIVGEGIARTLGSDLGKDSLHAGDVVQIGPRLCYVAGVMNPAGSFGSEVWSQDTPIKSYFNRVNYSSFVVRATSEEAAETLADKLKQFGGKNYNAFTESAYYKRLEENNRFFQIAVTVLGVIMAVGGVLGVMNTMFAAISQRAKDIGVMRLLGFTRFQILCSFLLESLVIALIGGILGCTIGLLANGLTANSIVGGQGGGKSVVLKLVVDGWVLGVGMTFALVMGAVGGLIPSVYAMRLKPLESLR